MTDYKKWDTFAKTVGTDDGDAASTDDTTPTNAKNETAKPRNVSAREWEGILAENQNLLASELKPFIAKQGLSLDLALCLACRHNQADLVEELLRSGADANSTEPVHGRSALRLALEYGVSAEKVIKLLVGHGAAAYQRDFDAKDDLNAGPLLFAATGEDADAGVIEYLVEHSKFPNREVRQQTLDDALFAACRAGTGRICRVLLRCGADAWGGLELEREALTSLRHLGTLDDGDGSAASAAPDTDARQKAPDGPNRAAASEGSTTPEPESSTAGGSAPKKRVDHQLRRVGNPNFRGGLTCLHYWASSNDAALLQAALCAFQASAASAASDGADEKVDALRRLYGGDLSRVRSISGETPLHIAIRANSLIAAQLLIDAGCDILAESANGHVALNLFQSREMFDLLVKAAEKKAAAKSGAVSMRDMFNFLPNVENNLGFTPLLTAIFHPKIPDEVILDLLSKHGADPNVEAAALPLVAAIRKNRSLVVLRALLREGAEVDRVEKQGGSTPLNVAVALAEKHELLSGETGSDDREKTREIESNTNMDVIKLLLSEGNGDPYLEDKTGTTPMLRCVTPRIYELFLQEAARRGRTQALAALSEGHGAPGGSDTSETAGRIASAEVDERRRLVNHVPGCGKTSLVLAAGSGNLQLMRLLLTNGADPDKSAPCTPLISAAANCMLESCELLVAGRVVSEGSGEADGAAETAKTSGGTAEKPKEAEEGLPASARADPKVQVRGKCAYQYLDKQDKNYARLMDLLSVDAVSPAAANGGS